jgi:hypothetical protein
MRSYFGFVIFILVIGFIVYVAVASDNFFDFFSFKFRIPISPVAPISTPINDEGSRREPPEKIETEEPPPRVDTQPKVTPPKGFTIEQLSPYYQQIRISSVSRGSYFFDNFTSLALSVYGAGEAIKVSDWRVQSNRGIILSVPRAVSDYNPRILASNEDIILEPGGSVIFYNTESPIRFNLRLNKCTGYLNNIYDFKPDLPKNCPYIDRNEIITFSGRCQSFIMSLSSCRQPTANEVNVFSTEPACRQLFDTLNYGGCYSRYRPAADFFSKEWRVWLGSSFNVVNLDREHDRLLLFDKNGLLVDEYVY